MEKTPVDKLKEMMNAKKVAEKQRHKEPSKKQANREESAPQEASQTSADDVLEQIRSAENEAKEHYDKLLRVMAEFENFKKRMEKEHLEQAKFSNQSLISEILPVLDDLDRAIEHIPQDAEGEVKALAEGVGMVQKHLLACLSKYGLCQVSSSPGTPFDPNTQEAVASVECKEHPEGTVAMEHRKGWMLHDRLIRPSMVSVSKG